MRTYLKYLSTECCPLGKCCWCVVYLLLAFGSVSQAQYYPAPVPVDRNKEAGLLRLLKTKVDVKKKIAILLSLSNININKPLRQTADLDQALRFARAASDLSERLHDTTAYNTARLYIADVLTFKRDGRSAEQIASGLDDSSKIRLWLNLSFKYLPKDIRRGSDSLEKSLLFAERAKKYSAGSGFLRLRAFAEIDVALGHAYKGLPLAQSELSKAIDQARAAGVPQQEYIYVQLAEYYLLAGKPDQGLRLWEQAIASMKLSGDMMPAGDVYYIGSALYYHKGDFQKSYELANLAIGYYKVFAGKYSQSDFFVNRAPAFALRSLGQFKAALQYATAAGKEFPPVSIRDQIADAMLLGDLYRQMKLYNKSEEAYLHAVSLNRKQALTNVALYQEIGQLYIEQKQFSKAKIYLDKAWQTNANAMTPAMSRHVNYMLFLADSAIGDYKAAVSHLSRYRGLEEVNLKELKAGEVKKLEAKYGTKQKENALKLKEQNITFLKQQNKLQEIKLEQSELEKDVTIAAICLLSAIIALLFKLYISKQRKYKEIKTIGEVITQKNGVIVHKNELIIKKSRQLELLLQEKEWLLKEVHHRVKNNLHTVICLLESQAAYLENDALKAIEKSQNRIYAMSLIYQKLYQATDLKTIDMAAYIPELVQYLKDSFEVADRVFFKYDLEKIGFDASLAIPVALIINEALTNSIKYAFPDKRQGEVLISLNRSGEMVILELSDNGIGIRLKGVRTDSGSKGLELMRGLTREIYGDINFSSSNGFKIKVVFKNNALDVIDEADLDEEIAY